MPTEYTQILYEVRDGVALVTLNRPDRMNALTYRMIAELIDAVDRIDADDEVRVAVVTGSGPRAFCAGADLEGDTFEPRDRSRGFSLDEHYDGGGRVALRIYESVKPFIAAVNGAAAGFGATITLPMDLRIAATTARFGFVFVRRGIVPESCSSWFLPRLVGMGTAAEWVYTGRVFGADEAYRAGLVRSLHEPDELLPAAIELARSLSANSAPVATALSRQLLWQMVGAPDPYRAHVLESRALFELAGSADVREGVDSFLGKRAAKFPLRVSTDLPNLAD